MRRSTVRFSIIAVCLSLAFPISCRMGSDVESFLEEGKGKITLSYDANGGIGSVGSVTAYKAVGCTATIADGSSLSRVSYAFAGWNAAAEGKGTVYAAGDTVRLDRDLTLYAQWTFNILLYGTTRHSLLAVKGGKVWCWGLGYLTKVTAISTFMTHCLALLSDVIAISAGNSHSLAIKSDGTVWGSNDHGQVGNAGASIFQKMPIRVDLTYSE